MVPASRGRAVRDGRNRAIRHRGRRRGRARRWSRLPGSVGALSLIVLTLARPRGSKRRPSASNQHRTLCARRVIRRGAGDFFCAAPTKNKFHRPAGLRDGWQAQRWRGPAAAGARPEKRDDRGCAARAENNSRVNSPVGEVALFRTPRLSPRRDECRGRTRIDSPDLRRFRLQARPAVSPGAAKAMAKQSRSRSGWLAREMGDGGDDDVGQLPRRSACSGGAASWIRRRRSSMAWSTSAWKRPPLLSK